MFLWENLKTVAKVAKEVWDQLFKRFTDNKPAIEKFGESVANFIKEFDFDTVKDSLNVVWEILKAIATTVEFVWDKIGKVVGAAWRVNERYNITEWISGFFWGFGLKGFTDVWASQIEETRNYKENLLNPATNKGGTININMNNNVIKDQADEKRTAQTISETIAKQNQSFINWIK